MRSRYPKISFPNVVEKKSTVHDKFWCVPLPKGKNYKRFLDFQNDVAVSDIEIALKEGYRSIEHVKRYTTLGMATDQGKTSNLNGLQLVSKIENKVVPAVGTLGSFGSVLLFYACVPLLGIARSREEKEGRLKD